MFSLDTRQEVITCDRVYCDYQCHSIFVY